MFTQEKQSVPGARKDVSLELPWKFSRRTLLSSRTW